MLLAMSILSAGITPHQVVASRLDVEGEQEIDLHRKGNAAIRIINEAGNPLGGLTVGYAQVSHDFLFGVGVTSSEPPSYYELPVFALLKDAGVNCALPYLTWKLTTESSHWIEQAYKPRELRDMDFTLIGHCLVWFNDKYGNLPAYAKQLSFEELKKEVKAHVSDVVARYKDWISIWGINEPNLEYTNSLHLTTHQWIEICKIAAAAIRETDPDGKVLVNMLIANIPQIGYFPIQFLRTLAKEGAQFDVIGLELYGNDKTPGTILDTNGYPVISWVSGRIDEFSQLGKPIILSEIGVPSKPSEETQAEWLKQVYTLAFSKPYVQSITWYFIYAPKSDPFYPDCGLFRAVKPRPEPKLAYYTHKELVTQWTTTGTRKTDENGTLHFRGYAGEYSIFAAGYKNSTIHVSEGKENTCTVALEMPSGAPVSTTTTVSMSKALVSTTTAVITLAIVVTIASLGIIALRRRGKEKTTLRPTDTIALWEPDRF